MKKALCIGLNYRGTEYELGGCINDADDWASVLNTVGFDCAVMTERAATKRNMLVGIETIVTGLKPGGVGVITFSGHGTWVPDLRNDEPDGRDEALCPIDCTSNLIIDDELHEIFEKIPNGSHVIFLADSCHSGTVFRVSDTQADVAGVRFIPPSVFTHTGVQMDRLCKAAALPVANPLGATDKSIPNLVHFSGCRDSEYSNDVVIDGRGCGIFTHYAIRAFLKGVKGGLTYADVHTEIRRKLPAPRYQQTPMLYAATPLKRRRVFST